jgi:exonuclease V
MSLRIDTKTRQKDSMPSEAQKRTTRFQLMLYNKLIQDFVCGKFCTAELLNFYGFKESDEISDDLKKQLTTLGIELKTNIKKLADISFGLFQILPIPEKIMNIRYEFQQNRKLIGIDKFSFEQSVFQKNCNFVEEYWLGKRKAVSVVINDTWKCKFCEFNNICEEKPVS